MNNQSLGTKSIPADMLNTLKEYFSQAKTGIFLVAFHHCLVNTQDQSNQGDYGNTTPIVRKYVDKNPCFISI